jgi:hypothetical protein
MKSKFDINGKIEFHKTQGGTWQGKTWNGEEWIFWKGFFLTKHEANQFAASKNHLAIFIE